jgi:sigma-B regulation protein RsbU (phosphoserine phosphatase)
MDGTGMPLGLFPDVQFASRHHPFEMGQMLVLGTDGATETTDVDGREFGGEGVLDFARVHALESAQEIAAGVYRAARAFGEADEQRDDITAVIVKFTGATPGLPQSMASA